MKNAECSAKKARILNSLCDIDDEFILEASPLERPAKKGRRSFIAAAAAIGIASAAALTLLILGSKGLLNVPEKKEAVLPPIRMSESPAIGSIGGPLGSARELIEGSDAIACVRIGDWLGDSGDTITTMFEAEVTEVIKGDLPKKITLLQGGTSEFTFAGHPLFTAGNELLVFLIKCENSPGRRYTLPDNSYVSAGAQITVFDIVTLENGEKYAIPRHRAHYSIMPAVSNLSGDRKLMQQALDALKEADSIWEEVNKDDRYLYSLDNFIAAIKRFSKE